MFHILIFQSNYRKSSAVTGLSRILLQDPNSNVRSSNWCITCALSESLVDLEVKTNIIHLELDLLQTWTLSFVREHHGPCLCKFLPPEKSICCLINSWNWMEYAYLLFKNIGPMLLDIWFNFQVALCGVKSWTWWSSWVPSNSGEWFCDYSDSHFIPTRLDFWVSSLLAFGIHSLMRQSIKGYCLKPTCEQFLTILH